MKKQIRTTAIASLMVLLVAIGSISAVLGGQTLETRADRMVGIAENASEKVGDLIDFVYADSTVLEMIETAGLTEDFENNVTLYDKGKENVTNAIEALENQDYEGTITNATEALSIFREVYRSIHIILYKSDVRVGQLIDVTELNEAIDRSLEKVEKLQGLISMEAPIYNNLIDAEQLLTEAKDLLLSENTEETKVKLRYTNILISEVVQYLKQVAQEMSNSRIRNYCDEAEQYKYRFRERFGQVESEGFDVNGFLEGFGFHNEDDFMARFQEMIEKAKGTEDPEEVFEILEEIGRYIREMDGSLTQEMGHHRNRYGQEVQSSDNNCGQYGGGYGQDSNAGSYSQAVSGSGYGQYGEGYGGAYGSGQVGYGSGH